MNRNMQVSAILVLLILPQLLSSCLKEVADSPPKIPARTLLFYMAGDNGKGEETEKKIEALLAAWKVPGRNHLIVYQDRGGEQPPHLLEIKTGEDGIGKLEVLKEYDDDNSASYEVFSRVLNDMTCLYPGTDYGLVLYSRTTGWLPAGTYVRPFSVLTDQTREFELADFVRAIPDGLFRFIVFESGLMAGAEVAYELRGKAETILASAAEVPSPGFAPLYVRMLDRLFTHTPDLTGFARDYYEYMCSLPQEQRSATISVIRPAALTPLKELLRRVESRVHYWELVDRSGMQHFDVRAENYLYYDLEGYIRTVGNPQENEELADILDKAVSYKAATTHFGATDEFGYEITRHCGLTLYVPISGFYYLNAERKKLRLFDRNS